MKPKSTPSRKQVRQQKSPRVNVPRASKRPTERSGQKRNRKG